MLIANHNLKAVRIININNAQKKKIVSKEQTKLGFHRHACIDGIC